MICHLTIRNRQQTRAVDLRLLRRIIATLLRDTLAVQRVDLGIYLVGTPEMTSLNERFLRHDGSTDVITFNYSERASRATNPAQSLNGEIFLCMDEAVRQSRRFRTRWQSEIVRYLIHGILHLLGHDDLHPAARRKMKLVENRLLRSIARRFPIVNLARGRKLPAPASD